MINFLQYTGRINYKKQKKTFFLNISGRLKKIVNDVSVSTHISDFNDENIKQNCIVEFFFLVNL